MFLAALRPSRNAQTETSRSSATPMIKAVCSTGLAPRIVVRFSALDSTAPGAAQGAFKNGAATASSPRFVNNLSFFGDEPSTLLLDHFLERALWSVTNVLTFALPNRNCGPTLFSSIPAASRESNQTAIVPFVADNGWK